MVAGTPAVAIEYLPKTGEIMAMAVGDGWAVPIEGVDGGRLLSTVQELHRRLPEIRERLAARIPELRTKGAANARLVRGLVEAAR
jgi:polysaccharide pyruvyl transferase WcaK-like protein